MNLLESLKEAVDSSILNQYENIYYLGSSISLNENELDEIIETNKLQEFLSAKKINVQFDLLDFYLLEKKNERNLIVIYSPFELFESESIFKSYSNIIENFSGLTSLEQLK